MRFLRRSSLICLLVSFGTLFLSAQPVERASPAVCHYEFTVTLPVTGDEIVGSAMLTVVRGMAAERLELDLLDLHVDSVSVAGSRSAFRRDPGTVDIVVGRAKAPAGDTTAVRIWYRGRVTDGLIVHTDQQGRWSAFGDNWPDRARRWLPVVDRPDAKATVTWKVVAPADRNVVANGRFVGREAFPPDPAQPSVKRIMTSWSIERPIPPYLMVIAAGPFVETELGLTAPGLSEFPPGVPQSVFAVPELSDYLPGPFSKAAEIVSLFAQLVAPFPYEKLAHVQSTTRYGGMENASAIFYADNTFMRRRITTGLIAHETAHQWFGDAVTPKSWGHLWLSEGFASYFEQLWVEKSDGAKAFRDGMKKLRSEILQSNVTFERPVLDTLQTNLLDLLNTNSYQKGAWTLHMLRTMLGDTVFFGSIREYYLAFRHGSATTDDLCAAFERTSGKTLRWYFDQWLRRPGAVDVTVGTEYNTGTRELVLSVFQNSKEFYRFPLTVEIVDSDGTSLFVTLDIGANRVTVIRLMNHSRRPAEIRFDPRNEVLGFVKKASE